MKDESRFKIAVIFLLSCCTIALIISLLLNAVKSGLY